MNITCGTLLGQVATTVTIGCMHSVQSAECNSVLAFYVDTGVRKGSGLYKNLPHHGSSRGNCLWYLKFSKSFCICFYIVAVLTNLVSAIFVNIFQSPTVLYILHIMTKCHNYNTVA